jgi:hypothetical protein
MVSSNDLKKIKPFRFGARHRTFNKKKTDPDFDANNGLLQAMWHKLKEKIGIGDFKKYVFKAEFLGRRMERGFEIKNLKMESYEQDNS